MDGQIAATAGGLGLLWLFFSLDNIRTNRCKMAGTTFNQVVPPPHCTSCNKEIENEDRAIFISIQKQTSFDALLIVFIISSKNGVYIIHNLTDHHGYFHVKLCCGCCFFLHTVDKEEPITLCSKVFFFFKQRT